MALMFDFLHSSEVSEIRAEVLATLVDYLFVYNESRNEFVLRSSSHRIEYPAMSDIIEFIAENGKVPSLTDLVNQEDKRELSKSARSEGGGFFGLLDY